MLLPSASPPMKDQAPVSVLPAGRRPPSVQGLPSGPGAPFSPSQTSTAVPDPSVLTSAPARSSHLPSSGSIVLTCTDFPGAPLVPFVPLVPSLPAEPPDPCGPVGPAAPGAPGAPGLPANFLAIFSTSFFWVELSFAAARAVPPRAAIKATQATIKPAVPNGSRIARIGWGRRFIGFPP